MGSRPVITVIGSYAVGLTMKTDRFPTRGETLIGHSYKQFHGGKGSNQAVGCARLGAHVNFITSIGKDAPGREALELYKREGINADYINFSDTCPTGVGFVIIDKKCDNIILLDPGANNELTPGYIKGLGEVIGASDAVLLQLEIPVETVMAAAKSAHEKGVRVILNPAPYKQIPTETWRYISIATPNEKEAKLILGYQPEDVISEERLGSELLQLGIGTAVITLGEKGAYIASSDRFELIPSFKVDAVDTTGAGDTFSAALGVAVAQGVDIEDAVRYANCAAALSVTVYGVIEAMPYKTRVDELLDK